jgi:peptide/nickel transport system substrate-binding protein
VVLAIFFTFCAGPAKAASDARSVTIVLEAEPEDLDPSTTVMRNVGLVLLKNIVEPLTEISPDDSSVSPRLATSWKRIDANTWQFALRKGVKFHDGKDFNAEVVVFNIKRLYDKGLASKTRAKFFGHLKMESRAIDPFTVEIKTDNAEPLMPTLMGTLAMCSPSTPMDKLTRNPVGTGAYKFVKWDAGTQIVTERFDEYWGKKPPVEKATYVWRKESSVRAAMVAIGEADLVAAIARQDANRPDLDKSYLNSETSYLRIGAWEAPFSDRRVRLALNLATDRNAIRGTILSKDVIPACQMIVPSIFGYNPDLKVWPYDPKKAKQLLDEARKDGVPVDKEILLVASMAGYPGASEVVEALMTMYRDVGLNVKLKFVETAVLRRYQDKPYPTDAGPYLLSKSHDNNQGDAVFTVYGKYHCNGVQSPICDKKVDELIEKAQTALGDERKNLWRQAFKRIHEEDIPDVMLFHMVGYCRVGKRINFKPSLATNGELELADITFK